MNFGGRGGHSGSNTSGIIPDASNTSNESIWATEEDYRNWNAEPHNGSEQPPSKKTWSSSQTDSQLNSSISKSKTIGKMFFKTKLCCKFRAGTCPYITNCNFAHGMQELRPPPPNWQELVADCNFAHGMQELRTPPPNLQELVAAHEEVLEPREENQIPILTSSSTLVGEGQRPYKGRHCKKFYTEEGCPYGDMCTFLHDEQSKARESVVISLLPSVGGGGYGVGSGVNGPNQKPSNWKTRICNKWEMTGQCPFGGKCHFAHGAEELHRYGGGLAEADGRDYSSIAIDTRQGNASSKDPFAASTSAPHQDVYHMGVPSQRTAVIGQRHGQRSPQKWKGPDKISRIYGDWIDDFE